MRIRLSQIAFLTLFVCASSTVAVEQRVFNHPGLMSSGTDLAALNVRATFHPIAHLGYEQLKQSPFADLARPHTPYAVVSVVAHKENEHEKAFRGDAHAAHATALMWVISQDERYRDKTMSILDDWAASYEGMKSIHTSARQTWLEAAWAAPVWTAAAELIRYYDGGKAGWKPEKVAAFDHFISRLVSTAGEARNMNNNWATSATLAIMAAAVYQENEAAYTEAITLYRQQLQSISMKNGALRTDYLRDPWHPQYTLLTWLQTCEIAWNQGDNLYDITLDGQSQPRLAICLEHFSNLFLGELPDPAGLKRGEYLGSHKDRQGYEIAFNHFIGRRHLDASMPALVKIMNTWRPGGIDNHFMAWDTLTHGGLAQTTIPPVRSQMDSWSYTDRKKLIQDGVLHNGMTPAEAESLLGPAFRTSAEAYDWYWNPGGRRHVAPFFRAKLKDGKLHNWQSGNR